MEAISYSASFMAGLGVMRFDNVFETCLGDQLVHPAQELLLAGLTALVAELAVGECKLLIHHMRPRSCAASIVSCGGLDHVAVTGRSCVVAKVQAQQSWAER